MAERPIRVLHLVVDDSTGGTLDPPSEEIDVRRIEISDPTDRSERRLEPLDSGEFDCVALGPSLGSVFECELLERIRERDPGTPIVFLTDDGDRSGSEVEISMKTANLFRTNSHGTDDSTGGTQLDAERIALLDRITDGFVAVDDEDAITFINRRAAELVRDVPNDDHGRDGSESEPEEDGRESAEIEAEAVGKPIWEVFPESSDTAFGEAFREAKSTGEATSVTIHYESIDRWFESRIYPSDTGVSMYFRDVTETVREREKLEQRERTMQRLHETISSTEEFERKVESLLELGCETLGVERGCLLRTDGADDGVEIITHEIERGTTVVTGTDSSDSVNDTARSAYESAFKTDDDEWIVEPGQSVRIPDTFEESDDGAMRFADAEIGCCIGAPVRVNETVYGTLRFFDSEPREPFSEWETTLVELQARWIGSEFERQRTAAEIERERDRLDAFASMVSHDLRNPLNVATGRLDMARTEHDSPNLKRSADALDRMDELIDDALSFAKLGSKVVEVESVDLAETAREAWATVDTRDATLSVGSPGVIAGDRSRVRTLFENLIRNAVEHGGDDVAVTVDRSENGFYVADDGPGIPEDDRESVFELGHTTSTTGTGFGLAIVRQIVDAHGWQITVGESDTGGARFEIHGVSHVLGVTTRSD